MSVSRPACRLAFMLLALGLAACAGPPDSSPEQDAELPPISPNRPTFSNSPGLIPVDRVQLESGYTFASPDADAESSRHNGPETVVRYRVSETVEARIQWGGYAWSETASEGRTVRDDGATDVGVSVLFPIAEQADWLPALTFEVGTTLGIGSEDFSSGHADPTLRLLWGYAGGFLPDWFGIGGNLIVSYPTEDGDRFTQPAASLFATFGDPDDDTSVFAEWFVIGRPANGVEATQSTDFGVIHRLSPRVAIDARVGFGLDSRSDDVFAGVGISYLF